MVAAGLERAIRMDELIWSVRIPTHVEAKDFRKIAPGRNGIIDLLALVYVLEKELQM